MVFSLVSLFDGYQGDNTSTFFVWQNFSVPVHTEHFAGLEIPFNSFHCPRRVDHSQLTHCFTDKHEFLWVMTETGSCSCDDQEC